MTQRNDTGLEELLQHCRRSITLGDDSLDWRDYENSDPVADIRDAAQYIQGDAVMLIGSELWLVLRSHPVIIDSCRCLAERKCNELCPFCADVGARPRPIMVTPTTLALALGIKAIICTYELEHSAILLDAQCGIRYREER